MEEIRRRFAARVAHAALLESDTLRAGFAAVRREDFVGPGPWQIMRSPDVSRGYQQTPDADPVHLYDLVTVALDPERLLNNGDPASLARWLDQLAIRSGTRFLHVGAGVVYYTAIVAQAASRAGHVLALEVDPVLAERAARNLVSPVGIFHCRGARSERGEQLLRASFGSGHVERVASLRRDSHSADAECWLHAASFCLSKRSPLAPIAGILTDAC